jgi:hypothetical protein
MRGPYGASVACGCKAAPSDAPRSDELCAMPTSAGLFNCEEDDKSPTDRTEFSVGLAPVVLLWLSGCPPMTNIKNKDPKVPMIPRPASFVLPLPHFGQRLDRLPPRGYHVFPQLAHLFNGRFVLRVVATIFPSIVSCSFPVIYGRNRKIFRSFKPGKK